MLTEDIWYIILIVGVGLSILSSLLLLKQFVIDSIKEPTNKLYLRKVFLTGSILLAVFHILAFALCYMAFTNSPNPLKALPLSILAGVLITAELMRELNKLVNKLEEVHRKRG